LVAEGQLGADAVGAVVVRIARVARGAAEGVAADAAEAAEVVLAAVVARLLAVGAGDENAAVAAQRRVTDGALAAGGAVAAAVRGEARRIARRVEAPAVLPLEDAAVAALHQVAAGSAGRRHAG